MCRNEGKDVIIVKKKKPLSWPSRWEVFLIGKGNFVEYLKRRSLLMAEQYVIRKAVVELILLKRLGDGKRIWIV